MPAASNLFHSVISTNRSKTKVFFNDSLATSGGEWRKGNILIDFFALSGFLIYIDEIMEDWLMCEKQHVYGHLGMFNYRVG
jgi:hypothetical protein